MVDITHKKNTLRIATAQATVRVSSTDTITAIETNRVPKGNVFEMSRAAGLLAVKKTPELLPDCHPLPIEFTGITYAIEGLNIRISCTIKTIYKTGVEVEAMHGASVVALNLYDMLKPIDKAIEIRQIKLITKKGGKSDYTLQTPSVTAAVIVCSDSISKGENEDKAGKAVIEKLENTKVSIREYTVIPDSIAAIQKIARAHSEQSTSLIIFVGGTGLSPRDQTPEALLPLLERRIPGIEEAMRAYGQDRTTYAMLSRSLAGMVGSSLVLGIPGSTGGATDSIAAIFPAVLHLFDIIKGATH